MTAAASPDRSPSPFAWGVGLNALLALVQLLVGLLSGSLALVGLAVHNLLDLLALLLAWGAEALAGRPPSPRFTWGLGRTTQLAALINALLILLAGGLVTAEALARLQDSALLQGLLQLWPPAGASAPVEAAPWWWIPAWLHRIGPVAGLQPLEPPPAAGPEPLPVLLATLAGVGVKLLAARRFAPGPEPNSAPEQPHDLNRHVAAVHLLSDAALMAVVLLSAGLASLTTWPWLDPLAALLVGAAVAASGLRLLGPSLLLALDGVPPGVELAAVQALLLALPGVVAVPELRLWGLSTGRTALCAHLQLADSPSEDQRQALLHSARQGLRHLGIACCTLELERRP